MKTDLIYGVEDRPPFKDALFAALQHLLAIFVATYHCECFETGCGEDEFSGLYVSLCFRSINFHSMSPFRNDRSRAALYSGNQFLFYRAYHCHRACRWITSNFRFLYGCRAHRDDCQPYF